MLGAIVGDIIGSLYEHHTIKTTKFPLFKLGSIFKDDTVLTLAVANAILTDGNYGSNIRLFAQHYPNAGYGQNFSIWFNSDSSTPYNSWGNGSAMRVSPIGFAYDNLEQVLNEAKKSAEVTHNHPEGIKGAQASASSVFLARVGKSKEEIKSYIETQFGYNLNFSLDDLRAHYKFDVSCQGSVPQSIFCFLESRDFEHAIRLAISIGGDSDTIACICGGIAHAFFKEIPKKIIKEIYERIETHQKRDFPLLKIIDSFCKTYHCF